MAQTLDNGIVVPINSDNWNLAPDLATMGNKTNAVTYCPDNAARDLLTKFVGRAAWVASTGILQFWTGTRWAVGSTTKLATSYVTPGTLMGASYATVATLNVTTLGGSVKLEYQGLITNGNSGEYRTADIEWAVDGTPPFSGNTFAAPYVAGIQPPTSVALTREATMSAGAHVITLKTRASAASSVYNTAFSVTASENPI